MNKSNVPSFGNQGHAILGKKKGKGKGRKNKRGVLFCTVY